jgi:hypothetical protein
MKLAIDLVPAPLWGKNLRKMLGKDAWYRLRDRAAPPGKPCVICRRNLGTHGHEVMNYLETGGQIAIAQLTAIIRICQDCHSVSHWGRFKALLKEKEITKKEFNRVLKHALAVNGCTKAEWNKHVEESFALWQHRSLLTWKIEFGAFQPRR